MASPETELARLTQRYKVKARPFAPLGPMPPSGQGAGVLGQVIRAGTAGEVLAPMVVEPLIAAAAAARQRGLAILADTGRHIQVGLRLPVLPETGVIEPGAFVRYDGGVERLGLVRSVSLEAGLPEVWQTLGVETHA